MAYSLLVLSQMSIAKGPAASEILVEASECRGAIRTSTLRHKTKRYTSTIDMGVFPIGKLVPF